MAKRRHLVVILVGLGLLMSALPATAVFGGSELITIPTGDVLRNDNWEIGLHGYMDGPWIVDFRWGFAPGWELGIDAIEDHDIGLGLKYQILEETKEGPSLALGVNDLGREDISPFISLSQRFHKSFIRWHLGLGGGRYDGIFLGLSTKLNTVHSSQQGNPISLMAEIVDNELNLGVSIDFAPGWRLNIGGNNDDILAGLTYKGSF